MIALPVRTPFLLPIILELLTLKYLRDRKKKKEAGKKGKSDGGTGGSKKPSGKGRLKFKLSVSPALA